MRLLCALLLVLFVASGARGMDARLLAEGISQAGRGNYPEAVLALRQAAPDGGGDAQYYYWLGRAYYGLRNYRLAAEALGNAVELDAAREDACFWHARALRMAGQDAAALEAYTVYADRFPRHLSLQLDYAGALALAGDLAGARGVVDAVAARVGPGRGRLEALRQSLEVLAARNRLEPLFILRERQFTLRYEPGERLQTQVAAEVERARREISEATGTEITGFRVLLFSTWASYSSYAGVVLPEGGEINTVAFSSPGLLVLWSPSEWGTRRDVGDTLGKVLRHEMAHLALMAHGRGEGVPVWLAEGIACYYGGWGGMRTGLLPDRPLSLLDLERSFAVGDAAEATTAYAQAHAMATVLAARLGPAGLFKLVDNLAAGTPLPAAYSALAGEPWDTFLAQWFTRNRALQQAAAP